MILTRTTLGILRDAVEEHALAHGVESPPLGWSDRCVEALQECLEDCESPEVFALPEVPA